MLIYTPWCELRLRRASFRETTTILFLKLFGAGTDFPDFFLHTSSAGLNRHWPDKVASWRQKICLKQSRHLFGFRVQINIIKTGPGRESRHCAHRSYQRVQKTSTNAGTDVTDGQNEASRGTLLLWVVR